jgi:hypothetical protein
MKELNKAKPHAVDLRFKITSQRDGTKYFNIPNVPRNSVKFDAESIERRHREANRDEQRRVQEQQAAEVREGIARADFEQLTFEDYTQQMRAKDRRIRELERHAVSLQQTFDAQQQSIEEKKATIHNLKRHCRKRSQSPLPTEASTLVTPSRPMKLDESAMKSLEQHVGNLVSKLGGLNRVTLLCPTWHDNNKTAANTLFGFQSFSETLVYINALFPDVDTTFRHTIQVRQNGTVTFQSHAKLSSLEQCLATKMFMHSLPNRAVVSRIYGRSNQRLSQVLREWAPRWGKAGEFLSILPMPSFYFDKEIPDEYIDRNLENVAALLDGKDFLIHVKRKDDFLRRVQHSNKMKAAAARGINWITGAGLSYEHTCLFAARATEVRLVQLWGSTGVQHAALEAWKDWARRGNNNLAGENREKLRLSLSIDDVDYKGMSSRAVNNHNTITTMPTAPTNVTLEYNVNTSTAQTNAIECNMESHTVTRSDVIHEVRNESSDSSDSDFISLDENSSDDDDSESNLNDYESELDDDDDSATDDDASEYEAEIDEVNEDPHETDQVNEDSPPKEKGSPYIDLLGMVESHYEHNRLDYTLKDECPDNTDKRRKSIFLRDRQDIRNDAKDALHSSPQHDPQQLLSQLELHERLNTLYETGKLKKTMLSYYLKTVRVYRLDILHWLGSAAVSVDYVPTYDEGNPPKVPLRLSKIPPGKEVLGDKGFERTDRLYPHLNHTRTPKVLRTRTVKQYNPDEIAGIGGKKDVCRLRYTSEVSFQRMTIMNGLKDVIPYKNLNMLPYMYEWGFAMINLCRTPLRLPGKNSGVGRDYFDGSETNDLTA